MPKKPPPETPLYVRLPASEVAGIPKKELVAGLVERYVDPDSARGLRALGQGTMGSYSFQPYDDAPEVMNADQAAALLQVEVKLVIELAEQGKLPGRKLGPHWRFSRAALVEWLSEPEAR
jgi:excisionase family DNA binding protein